MKNKLPLILSRISLLIIFILLTGSIISAFIGNAKYFFGFIIALLIFTIVMHIIIQHIKNQNNKGDNFEG